MRLVAFVVGSVGLYVMDRVSGVNPAEFIHVLLLLAAYGWCCVLDALLKATNDVETFRAFAEVLGERARAS